MLACGTGCSSVKINTLSNARDGEDQTEFGSGSRGVRHRTKLISLTDGLKDQRKRGVVGNRRVVIGCLTETVCSMV